MLEVMQKDTATAWRRLDQSEISPDEVYVHCYVSKKGVVILGGGDIQGKKTLVQRLGEQSNKRIITVDGELILNRVIKKTTYGIRNCPDKLDTDEYDVVCIENMELFKARKYARCKAGEVIADIAQKSLVILLINGIHSDYKGMLERINTEKLYTMCEIKNKETANVL